MQIWRPSRNEKILTDSGPNLSESTAIDGSVDTPLPDGTDDPRRPTHLVHYTGRGVFRADSPWRHAYAAAPAEVPRRGRTLVRRRLARSAHCLGRWCRAARAHADRDGRHR